MAQNISVALKNISGDAKHDVPSSSLLVPLASTPSDVSSLINFLLENGTEAVPFRCLVQGVLLQTSLRDLLETLGHVGEAQVTIEYMPATKLPEEQNQQVCPDWIRCIKSGWNNVLTGSFDSIIREHDERRVVKEFKGHKACVTSLDIINEQSFVSGSSDWTLRLWNRQTAETQAILRGHQAAVQCLAVSDSIICSGDFDGNISFWSTDVSTATVEPEPAKSKKKKAKRSTQVSNEGLPCMKPLSIVNAHKDGHVSGLRFDSEGRLFSAGLDHRLHVWDVVKQAKISTMTLGNQVSSFEVSRSSLFIASPDGHLKAFDTRSMKATTASVMLHEGWINAISCSPIDENQFCTAGADLRVCIWDRRGMASGPLKVLSGGSKTAAKKILAVDWTASGLYFGGEDCILHRFN